jgi:hypothetical protein
MSAAPTEPRLAQRAPLGALRLTWDIAPGEGARLASRRGLATPVDHATLTLDVRLAPHAQARVELRLGDTTLDTRHIPPHALAHTIDAERGLEHLDIQGVLCCTLRDGEAIYARAPIFSELGIPGGRYELQGTKDAER